MGFDTLGKHKAYICIVEECHLPEILDGSLYYLYSERLKYNRRFRNGFIYVKGNYNKIVATFTIEHVLRDSGWEILERTRGNTTARWRYFADNFGYRIPCMYAVKIKEVNLLKYPVKLKQLGISSKFNNFDLVSYNYLETLDTFA